MVALLEVDGGMDWDGLVRGGVCAGAERGGVPGGGSPGAGGRLADFRISGAYGQGGGVGRFTRCGRWICRRWSFVTLAHAGVWLWVSAEHLQFDGAGGGISSRGWTFSFAEGAPGRI